MLRQKVLHAIAWQSGAKIITQMFSFVVTTILARTLLPEDFGLIGMAIVFTGFIDLINEFGIGSSIIRKLDVTEEQLSSVFWFAIGVGISLFLVIFFSAPLIGLFYKNDQVIYVVRVLAIGLVVGSLRTIPFNLLSKEMKFGERSMAEIAAAISGGTIALVLAFYGFGVWSLVFNSLTNTFILTTLSFYFSGWRPRVVFRFLLVREMISFGIKIMGSRIQWYVYSNSDYLIIGRLLGQQILGYYTMAFTLAAFATDKITAVVSQVTIPAFSQLQCDTKRLQSAFLKTTKYVSTVTFPIMTILAVLAEEIVVILLTDKWLPIVFPLRMLCLIGSIRSIDVIIPQMLVANGKARFVLLYSTLLFFVLPLSFYIGCTINGIDGVAYAWLLVYPCMVSLLLYFGLRELQLKFRVYFKSIFPQLSGSFVMALVMVFSKSFLTATGAAISTMTIAAAVTGLGASAYVAYFYFFHRNETHEMLSLSAELFARRSTG